MNRSDPAAVLSALETLISDARDALSSSDRERLVLVHLANARECLRHVVETQWEPERPSYAPNNGQTRRTATEHFRKAREHAREATDIASAAVRRIRRES